MTLKIRQAGIHQSGAPGTRGWFAEFRPFERLTLMHMIDFVPGMDPYESRIQVDFPAICEPARMAVTIFPHRDPHWTKMSIEGLGSQPTKLDQRFGGPAIDAR